MSDHLDRAAEVLNEAVVEQVRAGEVTIEVHSKGVAFERALARVLDRAGLLAPAPDLWAVDDHGRRRPFGSEAAARRYADTHGGQVLARVPETWRPV